MDAILDMQCNDAMDEAELLGILAALANPHRLKILAHLARGRQYVSQLARDIEVSRPLLHMHLKRLADVGLVGSEMEVSADGKAMKFYHLTDFRMVLTPELISQVVQLDAESGEGLTALTSREEEHG